MTTPPLVDDPFRLLRDLQGLVALHQRFGIDSYPKTPELARFVDAPPAARPVAGKPAPPPARRQEGQTLPLAQEPPPPFLRSGQTLDELRQRLDQACSCPAQEGRGQIVFGQGNPQAALFIVGDLPTPGQEGGSPFGGEAGELLTRMLKAIGLEREAVYLTTLIKCRPQGHLAEAAPTAAMVQACLPLLIAQIEAVAPKVICVMGQLAAQALLHTATPLVRLRGHFHPWQRFPLMPTFAPDFLLKNPEMKKAAWIDLQLIQERLGSA